jgi:hypothetical protein
MKINHEVRFKLSSNEYQYFKNFANFMFDFAVIPAPSVHRLGKLAIRKLAYDWMEIEDNALQNRLERHKVLHPLNTDGNKDKSNPAALSQTTFSTQKVKPV